MGEISQATREIMWNISGAPMMYLLFLISLVIFGYGMFRRIAAWKKGKPDPERFSRLPGRFVKMVREVLLQRKNWKFLFPGVFHAMFFYSFLILLMTTVIILMDYDLGTHLFNGYLYAFLTVLSDFAGMFILAGILLAAWRRYALAPKTLETEASDAGILFLLGLMVITGFLVQGLRMAAAGDAWPFLSPIGYVTGGLFQGLSKDTGKTWHALLWWTHALSVFVFISLIPYTKLFHLLAIPANAFFSKLKPPGELNRIDLEALMESEDFDEADFNIGTDTIADLTWKQRLDMDACVRCGRCEEVCPASMAGQPLSPKAFILNIKRLANPVKHNGEHDQDGAGPSVEIVGNAFDEDFIWYCRTCMACTEVCPAFVEHVDALIDIRRNEVNMKGRVHPEAARLLKSFESKGNPFGPQEERVDWIDTLGVPVVGPGEACDVLYWIGCLTTFDSTKQQIARDVIHLLQQCGIDFGVLGAGEMCCGDPVRVTGEENLFQMAAKEQVAELNKRRFNTLLTACPHCYNVLKNEYPQFGGHYKVVHHTEFLDQRVRAGSITPAAGENRVATYHDPCFLGRYQKIYGAPRNALASIPGLRTREMENHKDKSLCCGGGGGHFWMDIKEGERINNLRIKQAKDTGADLIATACPFCRHMLEDSLKLMNLDEQMAVADIASLFVSSAEKKEKTNAGH